MRTRWICLGTLKQGGQIIVFGGAWVRCCVSIDWVARQNGNDWCQPWQFTDWAGLQWAVERRLALAGLRPLAYASHLLDDGLRHHYQPLWVQVMRREKLV